jgi:DNA-directed RNA polymerase sigma subunit (sigma70/sigma32)
MSLQDLKRYAFGGNPALADHDDRQVPAGLTDAILLDIMEKYLTAFQYEVVRLNFGLGGPSVCAQEIATYLNTTLDRVRRQRMNAMREIRSACRERNFS